MTPTGLLSNNSRVPKPANRNAKKGAYYKARTRRWLERKGFAVGDMEIVKWIHPPNRAPLPVKRDQFGADLIAIRPDGIVFVQVKGGEQAAGNSQFLDAQREFASHPFPRFATLWIVCWAPRATRPRIITPART